jgi:hypothetical protein
MEYVICPIFYGMSEIKEIDIPMTLGFYMLAW